MFGAVERRVNHLQDICSHRAIFRKDRNAKRNCNRFKNVSLEWDPKLTGVLAKHFSASASNFQWGIWHHDDKLIAAVTTGNVFAAHMLQQQAAYCTQDLIASGMAVAVIE